MKDSYLFKKVEYYQPELFTYLLLSLASSLPIDCSVVKEGMSTNAGRHCWACLTVCCVLRKERDEFSPLPANLQGDTGALPSREEKWFRAWRWASYLSFGGYTIWQEASVCVCVCHALLDREEVTDGKAINYCTCSSHCPPTVQHTPCGTHCCGRAPRPPVTSTPKWVRKKRSSKVALVGHRVAASGDSATQRPPGGKLTSTSMLWLLGGRGKQSFLGGCARGFPEVLDGSVIPAGHVSHHVDADSSATHKLPCPGAGVGLAMCCAPWSTLRPQYPHTTF